MKLSELASVRTGLVLSRKQSNHVDNVAVQYEQLNLKCIIDSGDIDIELLDIFIAAERLKWDYLTHKGDVVVRLSSPYTAVLITEECEGLVVPSHFVTIRADGKHLSPEYLFWLLNTEKIKKNIMQNNSGSMLGTIKPSFFAELDIKLIPIEKQHLVANINLLAKKESKLLEMLKEQKGIYYRELTKTIQKQMGKGNK
jgi:hypothetical protein